MRKVSAILRYVPPPTREQIKEYEKTYGYDASKTRSQKDFMKLVERAAQDLVNDLAKRDGIAPPKVEISPNAELWTNGNRSGGFYIRKRNGKGLIAIGTTVAGSTTTEAGCSLFELAILHEYRHHYQSARLGTQKVQEIYEGEGPVSHSEHVLEQDAEDFARKNCRRVR